MLKQILVIIAAVVIVLTEAQDELQANAGCEALYERVAAVWTEEKCPMISFGLNFMDNITNSIDTLMSLNDCIWDEVKDLPIITNLMEECQQTTPSTSETDAIQGVNTILCLIDRLIKASLYLSNL
ncbi:hypothetical protein CHUAL_000302 [Chamberlinius hualienensis]